MRRKADDCAGSAPLRESGDLGRQARRPYGVAMSATSHTVRARWAAVGAAIAITLGAAGISGYGIVSADVSADNQSAFVPITPCRLVDTRPAPRTVGPRSIPLGPGETITVTAHGSNGECTGLSAIPTDAVGLATNVTALGPTANTFLTLWGEGANPGTSNLNPRAGGAPTPNSVNTPLSSTGTFNIFNNRGNTNVIVDVNGYYAKIDSTARFESFTIPGFGFTGNALADPDQPENGSFAFTSDVGACATAPVEIPFDATTMDWSIGAAYGIGDFTISMAYYDHTPGTSAIDAATPVEIFSDDVALLGPSPNIVTIDSALISLAGFRVGYAEIEICSDDSLDVYEFGARFRF